MKKFQKAKLAEYPLEILKTYPQKFKDEFAKSSIKAKDYLGFKKILEASESPSSYLNYAIESIDISIVNLLIDNAKNSADESI